MSVLQSRNDYTPAELVAAIRTNFYAFVRMVFLELHRGSKNRFIAAWHVEAVCYQLQQLAEGDIRRLAISVPPRHLKSITAAVAYPAWVLGRHPERKVIVATYGHDLSGQHSRQFRTVIESDWYRRAFPNMRIDPRLNHTLETGTTAGGYRKAVSVLGPITGYGATDIVIDDLMKATDAGSEPERQRVKDYYGNLVTRLDNKGTGRIVSIQQRLHEDDLPAHLLNSGNFEHLELKAIAEIDEVHQRYDGRTTERRAGEALFPEREPLEVLEEIRRELGSYVFSAQYQQNPTSPDGNLVRREWLQSYEGDRERSECVRVVQSWDTAVTAEPTSDYSACITAGWKNGQWYLLDVWRDRLEYPALRKFIRRHANDWDADKILIEYANTGITLLTELKRELPDKIIGCRPRGDKTSRLIAQTGKLEAGLLRFPERAQWLQKLRREIFSFPNGRYDDQVDALSQFLAWLDTGQANALLNRNPITGRPRRPRRPSRARLDLRDLPNMYPSAPLRKRRFG